MKINSFIYKLFIVNGLVAIFILGTYFTIDYFIKSKLEDITDKRKVIKTIVSEAEKVNINLLKSATLKSNKYLAEGIKNSNNLNTLIEALDKYGYDTKQLKEDYSEFFKYSVMTTSMFIENRANEAIDNNNLAEEKQKKLAKTLSDFVLQLDQTQSDISTKIDYLMMSSYFLLLIILIKNISYINYHFKVSKQRNEESATMLETIGDGVYGVDLEGNCTFINQSALDMIQFSKEEVLHQHQHHLFHHHKPDGSHYESEDCPIFKTLVDKKTRILKDSFIRKDNTFLPVSLTVSALEGRGAIVVFKDITEELNNEKNLQDRIDNKTKELQELNNNLEKTIKEEIEKNNYQFMLLEQQSRLAALGEMIGNIAHQWRQPLSAITVAISGLHLKYELEMMGEDDLTETKNSIIKNANYLSHTIDDFRNFVKNEHAEVSFNISKVIDEVYSIVYPTLKDSNINVEFNTDKTLEYTGYPNELSQAILNILNNAKDTLNYKEVENKVIKIDLFTDNKKVYILIGDNAGGVPNEIKSKIFDPYFTTKHQSQGTGLGLYMSSKIITEKFAGELLCEDCTMEINNVKFDGALFKIVLAA